MPIVRFAFTKMDAQRNALPDGPVTINSKIAFKKVENADLLLGKSQQDGLRLTFEFVSSYGPDVGKIALTGEILYIDEQEKIASMTAAWKKDKKLDDNTNRLLLAPVLDKCNIQALFLSKDLELPPPVQLPRLG
ncbi:hypothetical protein COY28_06580 [Candidatus Woesearchaeota archaeon CG_4_10_14_0_2_um_filter_57_5]|nr:MAG: hypothetical protein AUJ68_04015 [Candidatus Woesearchaeota archaeon CG1_02_57_44]PIZ49186.1 MAG: hypothetical protein COY28_06580 [Candidatus Woesearchaeota archaeon CG_4_10_14_0_2_um_filter_57_5]